MGETSGYVRVLLCWRALTSVMLEIKLKLYYIIQATIIALGNSPELQKMASKLEEELLAE